MTHHPATVVSDVDLSARIRARLGVLHMSQRQLATAMGVEVRTINRRLAAQPQGAFTVNELGLIAHIVRLRIETLLDPDVDRAGPEVLTPPPTDETEVTATRR